MKFPDLANDCKARTAKKQKERIEMFARIGRWGTCCDCPTDGLGNYYPELCKNTNRPDHHLTAKDLADSFDSELKRQESAKGSLGDDYRFTIV